MSYAVFHYPKSKHARTTQPRTFKRYQSYKRFLQYEFLRVCVYCRQPDSSAPNLNFGVDHYRPKGIAKFANLICEYSNLYYCCGNCNSRKSNDWPTDEKSGPYVVNPCDHIMSQHLKFESSSGKVVTRTKHGKHTEDLLQLNDPTLVEFRKTTLYALKIAELTLGALKINKTELSHLLKIKKISINDYNDAILEIDNEIELTTKFIENMSGSKPLPPLRKTRLGIKII